MERPALNETISLADFNDFYWLKAELVSFCQKAGIRTAGGKIELSERIRFFLSAGHTSTRPRPIQKPQSIFDWRVAPLSTSTLITDNYQNTENVRTFFRGEIGAHFAFNVRFMAWMKANTQKTLLDAIEEWKRLHELKKNARQQTEIAPQFEYNRYLRAFLADNPTLTRQDALRCWNLKKARRGTNEYEPADLQLGPA